MTVEEHIAGLVAEAPRFTPADIAELSLIMAPVFAAMDADGIEAHDPTPDDERQTSRTRQVWDSLPEHFRQAVMAAPP